MTKIFNVGALIFTVVLSACGAQAMTSLQNQGKAVQPQGHYLCAGATWPQIPAVCLEGGSGHEVRYALAPIDEEITANIASRFNWAFK
jgi:hypothetical protein